MSIRWQKDFLIRFAFFSVMAALTYVGIQYGLAVLMPFILAFLFAGVLKHPIAFLTERLKFKRTPAAILVVVLFFSLVGLLLGLLGLRVFAVSGGLFLKLPSFYMETVEPAIREALAWLEISLSTLDPAMQATVGEAITKSLDASAGFVTSASMSVIGSISNFAGSLPGLFINFVVTIVVTFFVTVDYETFTGFLMRQFSEGAGKIALEIKDFVSGTLLKCILSYGMIMTLTFVELSVGLSIIKIPNAIAIAFFIAVFDILPVLGTGGIMIPWVILTAVTGNYKLAVSIGIIYLIVTVVRNILEPKIVGHQVGLHPVVTLASMLVGLKLLGVVGLFGFPIALSLVKNLNDRGAIHVFK